MPIRQNLTHTERLALQSFAGDLTGKHVLEIGCGNGRLTQQYAAQAATVHGIDPDPDKIAAAYDQLPPDLAPSVSFEAASIETFIPPTTYDVVLLAWSL